MIGNFQEEYMSSVKSTNEGQRISVDNSSVERSSCKKFLLFQIDSKYAFDDHVIETREKASKKLNRFASATPCVMIEKNSFFSSQLNYCQII